VDTIASPHHYQQEGGPYHYNEFEEAAIYQMAEHEQGHHHEYLPKSYVTNLLKNGPHRKVHTKGLSSPAEHYAHEVATTQKAFLETYNGWEEYRKAHQPHIDDGFQPSRPYHEESYSPIHTYAEQQEKPIVEEQAESYDAWGEYVKAQQKAPVRQHKQIVLHQAFANNPVKEYAHTTQSTPQHYLAHVEAPAPFSVPHNSYKFEYKGKNGGYKSNW
jgi:hypothetical protein